MQVIWGALAEGLLRASCSTTNAGLPRDGGTQAWPGRSRSRRHAVPRRDRPPEAVGAAGSTETLRAAAQIMAVTDEDLRAAAEPGRVHADRSAGSTYLLSGWPSRACRLDGLELARSSLVPKRRPSVGPLQAWPEDHGRPTLTTPHTADNDATASLCPWRALAF